MEITFNFLVELASAIDGYKLLDVIATPVALLIIAFLVTRRTTIRESKIANESKQQESFKQYLSIMTTLLVENQLQSASIEDGSVQAAKSLTLAVLRELDHNRRLQLINFLRDSGLIQKRKLSNIGPMLFEGASLTGIDLSYADLREVNLNKADLSGTNLAGAYLSNANLVGANLERVNLKEARLSHADLSCTFLYKANLDKASLYGANLRDARLDEASLRGAYLREAKLSGTVFSALKTLEQLSDNIESLMFREYGLKKLILFRPYCCWLTIRQLSSRGAKLQGADLGNADLTNADLLRVNLQEASLREANLKDANLMYANLWAADLRGANLEEARMNGANTFRTKF